MQLSEFSVVTGRLAADLQHHKDMATFYLRLFNQNTPKPGGKVDIRTSTELQDFYQQLSQHHQVIAWQCSDQIKAYRCLANEILLHLGEQN